MFGRREKFREGAGRDMDNWANAKLQSPVGTSNPNESQDFGRRPLSVLIWGVRWRLQVRMVPDLRLVSISEILPRRHSTRRRSPLMCRSSSFFAEFFLSCQRPPFSLFLARESLVARHEETTRAPALRKQRTRLRWRDANPIFAQERQSKKSIVRHTPSP